MKIDLHTHSYFSDGECSPEDVILESKKCKISVLSITDHNTIRYDESASKIAKNNGIDFIEGIEVSTVHTLLEDNVSLHVLGYGKILNKELLRQKLQKIIDGYNNRAIKIIDKLNHEFPELCLDFDKVRESGHESYVSRNTLARLLVEHTNNLSIKEALKRYVFIEEDNSWMMKTKDSFQLIAQSNGLPVLAHSGRELRKMGLSTYESMIKQLVQLGLRGLEVYYPKHSIEETNTIRNIANKYGLYITGGSDWHGLSYTPDVQLGLDNNEKDFIPFLNDVVSISL